MGLNRTATYVWSYAELKSQQHLINGIAGTYGIYNNINGKFYVGSSNNIRSRLNHHLLNATSRTSNRWLQFALKKYGLINFQIIIFDTIPKSNLINKDVLIDLENRLFNDISFKNKFYNFNLQANSSLGVKFSDATKCLMSLRTSGGKNPAAVSITLVDLMLDQVHYLSTIKEVAPIVGCSVNNIYKISKRNPPIFIYRWLILKNK
jgi:group I intron endonuclease